MDYDDIQPVLNPCQAADLAQYLLTWPPPSVVWSDEEGAA